MAKFSGAARARLPGSSPVSTTAGPTTSTHEGGPGWSRDAKSDLYLLALTDLVGEETFYEPADVRDARFRALVHELVRDGEAEWVARFVPYLRGRLHMRSAAVVMAAEYALALRPDGVPAGLSPEAWTTVRKQAPAVRQVVSDALQRGDEPAEYVAYWRLRTGGRGLPAGVQRGVADAVRRLYTERAALRYDGVSRGYRMGDVLALARPAPSGPEQAELFRYLLDHRHGRDVRADLSCLPMLRARQDLHAIPREDRRAFLRSDAGPGEVLRSGMPWEEVSGWLDGPMDAAAWEAVIPGMGYMALLRNLRNFDQAGVSDEVAHRVATRLADPEQVAASRQLPMRFLSAYRTAPSLRWSHALEQALGHCLANVPALAGRTLVLVDTSTSMDATFSRDGALKRWDAAVLFGAALAQRCDAADLVSFSSTMKCRCDPPGTETGVFPQVRGESLLRSLERWRSDGYFLEGGTETAGAVLRHFAGHDRVVILTDEQASGPDDPTASVPESVPVYTWNLAGYDRAHAPSGSGNRHTFGGLTDAGFRAIPVLEQRRSASWPF